MILSWTTTPWTLPSNLIVAVNPDFTYVKIKDINAEKSLIVAECRLKDLYKSSEEY